MNYSAMKAAIKAAMKETFAAEKDINQEENNTSSNTFKGGAKATRCWSDIYVKKVTIINLRKATIKYCNIPKHRKNKYNNKKDSLQMQAHEPIRNGK